MPNSEIWRDSEYLCAPYYNFKNKEMCINNHVVYMLDKTNRMFVWGNLPDSIPARDLEMILQTRGYAVFKKVNDTLYAFGISTSLGGARNVYYMPTTVNINNPYLQYSGNGLKIDEECVVMPSDTAYQGLLPIFRKYGTLLVENELTFLRAIIDSRCIDIIETPNDNTAKAADTFLKSIEKGDAAYLNSNSFMKDVHVFSRSVATSRRITDLIETEQYLKACELGEIGLDANFNMKRESINSNEAQLNDDALIPFVDDMLNMRRIGIEKVNKMYGTNITVELSDTWRHRREAVVEDVDLDVDDPPSETDSKEDGTSMKGGEENAENN